MFVAVAEVVYDTMEEIKKNWQLLGVLASTLAIDVLQVMQIVVTARLPFTTFSDGDTSVYIINSSCQIDQTNNEPMKSFNFHSFRVLLSMHMHLGFPDLEMPEH